MNTDIMEIIKNIENKSDLKSNDIPSLDLYIDQIMSLFDDHLSNNKRHSSDKLLTKTMINNYSKEGLIKPIKGKKYSKEHILQMLLIYSLKNTLSIQEIKAILQPYHQEMEKIKPVYDEFLQIKKEVTQTIIQSLQNIIEHHHLNSHQLDDLTILLLLICSYSNQYKMIAESILDQYYLNEHNDCK